MAQQKHQDLSEDDEDSGEFVTRHECKSRTSSNRWVMGILLSVIICFMGLVTLTYSQTNEMKASTEAAIKRVDSVDTSLKMHEAVEAEKSKQILEALQQIKNDVKDLKAAKNLP